jgi:hypothetical protein
MYDPPAFAITLERLPSIYEPVLATTDPAVLFVILTVSAGDTDSIPLERVRVPATVKLDGSETPDGLLIVKLLSAVTLVGIAIPVKEPPNTRDEAAVVVRLDGFPEIAGPFNVSVLPATANDPDEIVRFPLTMALPPRVFTPEPDITRLLYDTPATV